MPNAMVAAVSRITGVNPHRKRGAGYVDHILKGAKPKDAGRAATKFQLSINLSTAKALSLNAMDSAAGPIPAQSSRELIAHVS
jgi:hypothetical protein